MKLLEKIRSLGYDIKLKENAPKAKVPSLVVVNPAGVSKDLPPRMKSMIVGRLDPGEQAEAAIKKGTAIKFDVIDIYKEFHNLDDEATCRLEHGCSVRSHQAIEAALSAIGCVDYNAGEMLENKVLEDEEVVGEFFNSSEVRVGISREDNLWYAEFGVMADIDALVIYQIGFAWKPSFDDVYRAYKINDIALQFRLSEFKPGISESFSCRDCGHEMFWLDCDKDVAKAFEMACDKYCGC